MKTSTWKLYFKIFAFIITLAFLIAAYLVSMISKTWVPKSDLPFFYGDFTLQYLSFFTTQSNILVCVWFLLASINDRDENRSVLTGQTSKIFVTSYITITMIIWLTVLMPPSAKVMTASSWILGLGQHLLVPVLMIVYAMFTIGEDKVEWRPYFKKNFWIYLSYPFGYLVYVMIRGQMRWADGKGKLSYPYDFLNPYTPTFNMNGVLGFFIFFILIFVLFIAANLLYLAINNWLFKRK